MAITITGITGIGGNPPSQIRVEGTVTGCEVIQILSSCSTNPVQISIPTGSLNQWSVDLPNDKGCGCGTNVKVTAWCGIGEPDSTTVTTTLSLICDNCPVITITAAPGPCVNGKRSVTYQASVAGVSGTTVLQWSFPNGTPTSSNATTAFVVTTNGALPSQNVEYPANTTGPVTQTASLDTILPIGCPPATVSVTIKPCPVCCPSLTLSQPVITGWAPGTVGVSFNAALTWTDECTPITATSYEWTLNGPGGLKYQRSTTQPITDTNTPWIDPVSGNSATIQFVPGNYSVGITAVIPGVSLPCNPTDTKSFSVNACCPQLIGPLNASPKTDDPCTWLFSAQVSNPNNAPVTFEWSFQDGTTASTSVPQVTHTYVPGSVTTGTTTVTLKSTGCPDQKLSVPVTHNCKPSIPPTNGGFNLCAGLLVTAIALALLGGIVAIVGVCINVPWVWIAGAIIGGVGFALFVLWVILCSRTTPCTIMRTIHCILFWIVAVVAPIIAIIASLSGGLPCFLATVAAWAGWGTLYAWLGFIMRRVGCVPTC